jgi:hypothetical protein
VLALPELVDPPGGGTAFADHLDAGVLHRLPDGLELARTPAGDPDFLLLRYRGDLEVTGGLLRLGLALRPPPSAAVVVAEAAGLRLRPVAFDQGRLRLRLRSPALAGPEPPGGWQPVVFHGDELAVPAVGLTAHEAQLLHRLLLEGVGAVEVEVELGYQGLVQGRPWLIGAATAALKERLGALLPPEPARADQVAAAFGSLAAAADGVVWWRPLEPDATPATPEELLAEAGRRAVDRPFLFEPERSADQAPRYRLLPATAGDPPTVALDLEPPRLERRRHQLGWSVSELYAEFDDPASRQRYFPVASQAGPFDSVDVLVVGLVPFDPRYLRKVAVDLRWNGPSGLSEFHRVVLDADTPNARFTAVYPAVAGAFALEYRLEATLAAPAGGGWPQVVRRPYAPATGPVVEVGRRALGVDAVRVEAEAAVFQRAAAVQVAIGRDPAGAPLTRQTLTGDDSGAWVACPGVSPEDELFVCADATAPDPAMPTHRLRDGPVADRQVRITAAELEVLAPETVTISLHPEWVGRFGYVGVALQPPAGTERYRTLAFDEPVTVPMFRASVFEPLRYRYRVDYVALDAGGDPLPLTSTDWRDAEGTALVLDPPIRDLQPVP